MLIQFRVKNYKSLKDEQIVSLVASSDKTLSHNTIRIEEIRNTKLLKTIVIYGANASGKSNILDALSVVRKLVRGTFLRGIQRQEIDRPIPVEPFLLDSDTATSPSEFELTFISNGIRYQYGFTVDVNRVFSEYMYGAPKGRLVPFFQRLWNAEKGFEEYYFGPSLKGQNEMLKDLTRKNSLFLTVAATFNHPMLSAPYLWITSNLRKVTSRQHLRPRKFSGRENDKFHNHVKELLRFADLGIMDYQYTEREEPNLFDNQHDVEQSRERKWKYYELELLHQRKDGLQTLFNESMESNGTRTYMELACSLLEALDNGSVVLVDELDQSLHPLLARSLVELFHNTSTNPLNAQLIFNTHDTTLLDQEIFRRDQIWFSEKDQDGCSHVYSLLKYSPRKGESLSRGYLQGRYGAIPFIGDTSLIFSDDEDNQ